MVNAFWEKYLFMRDIIFQIKGTKPQIASRESLID